MPEWYETFADEAVLARSHARSRRAVVVFALVSGALVAAAPVASLLLPRGAGVAVAAGCGLALLAHAAWLLARLARLHRAVWCVRLSARHLVADDGGRRRRTLPWVGVVRLDLGTEALTVDGLCADGSAATVVVPADFEGHDLLARRLVDYAVAFRCTVCVDGEPLQSLSLTSALAAPRPTAGLAGDEPPHDDR